MFLNIMFLVMLLSQVFCCYIRNSYMRVVL